MANRNLGPMFHGTDAHLNEGDLVEPRVQGLAWASTNRDVAAEYGKHIYEVHPAEDQERVKAAAAKFGIYASRTGFKVKGRHS